MSILFTPKQTAALMGLFEKHPQHRSLALNDYPSSDGSVLVVLSHIPDMQGHGLATSVTYRIWRDGEIKGPQPPVPTL